LLPGLLQPVVPQDLYRLRQAEVGHRIGLQAGMAVKEAAWDTGGSWAAGSEGCNEPRTDDAGGSDMKKATTTMRAIDPAGQKGELKSIGGSNSDNWNNLLANQVVNSLWTKHSDEGQKNRQFEGTISGLIGIDPRDELEGMMAAQLIAAHNAAMECYRRAMLPEQTFQGRSEALNQANKLSRTYVTLVEALNRHRGKGQQKVTVEHVHVHAGGQAVVGVVEGGGDRAKSKDQPHALGYAPGEKMRSTNKEGDALPVPRDG
jgi:hypothetical protein